MKIKNLHTGKWIFSRVEVFSVIFNTIVLST